jgi:amino acid transporter
MDFLFLYKKYMPSVLSTYTKVELNKKLKTQKNLLIVKGIVIVLMIVFAVFSTLENGISFHTFLPLFFIPMGLFMYFELKNIKKELASRKQDETRKDNI